MTVYVDSAFIKLGRMRMCHMVADTFEELHAMADAIGVERRWFQADASFPHYDICKTKRAIALELGAKLADRKQLVAVMDGVRRGVEIARGSDGWVLIAQFAVKTVSVRSALQVAAAVSAMRDPGESGKVHGFEWMQLGAWRAKYESPAPTTSHIQD